MQCNDCETTYYYKTLILGWDWTLFVIINEIGFGIYMKTILDGVWFIRFCKLAKVKNSKPTFTSMCSDKCDAYYCFVLE